MTREKFFAVLLLGLLTIALSLPQQQKPKRPNPVFKVFEMSIFLHSFSPTNSLWIIAYNNIHNNRLSHLNFFSHLKLVACCFPTTQRSFARTSSTRFRARTEFTVIMPTWRTSAKCFTCACHKRGAQLDGASFVPPRQFSTK